MDGEIDSTDSHVYPQTKSIGCRRRIGDTRIDCAEPAQMAGINWTWFRYEYRGHRQLFCLANVARFRSGGDRRELLGNRLGTAAGRILSDSTRYAFRLRSCGDRSQR